MSDPRKVFRNCRSTSHLKSSPSDRRQLRFESLEDRLLLAVYPVSNLDDAGPGSLRDAINLANGTAEADTIQFSAEGTINLESQLPTISTDLTIVGGNQITIDAGGGLTSDAGDGFRIFRIDDGSNDTEITVTLAGLKLTGADTPLSDLFGNGGAIYNREQLTLIGSTVVDNQARGGAGVWSDRGTQYIIDSTLTQNNASSSGGGIFNNAASTTYVISSTLASNSASGGGGGGITNSGTLNVANSNLSANIATSSGGGLFTIGVATISNSTVADNSAVISGGGILNGASGTLNVSNSTLSGNTSPTGMGGGLSNFGAASISSSTFSGNSSRDGGGIDNSLTGTVNIASSTLTANGATASGGGVSNSATATMHVTSSIVAGNTANTSNDDVDGTLTSDDFNLLGGDPLLAPLADNGGPTRTHALLPGSPAFNLGDPSIAGGFDQRGLPFHRVIGGRADIGAYESQPQTFVVNNPGDVDDGLPDNGVTTLREAIHLANSRIGVADTIAFDPAVFTGGTNSLIRLSGTALEITETLTIDASTATGVTITGDAADNDITDGLNITDIEASLANSATSLNDNSSVLNYSSMSGDLTLVGLTVTGGRSLDSGGGIQFYSDGVLTLTSSTVSGNSSGQPGGGIVSIDGAVSLIDSTVSGNSSDTRGGGIAAIRNVVNLNRSTVSNNSSVDQGGGVFVIESALTLLSSMVIGNSSGQAGGGLYVLESDLSLTSSLVIGNNSADRGGGIYLIDDQVNVHAFTLMSSQVSGNTSGSYGGGIYTRRGDLMLTNSTVSDNTSVEGGGGIGASLSDLILTSSTVSDNTSGDLGGGIIATASDLILTSSTVSGNVAGGTGGGGYVLNSTITIENSILAGNTQNGGEPNDLNDNSSGTLTVTSSLIGVNSEVNLPGAPIGMPDSNGNLIGIASNLIDPLLGPLADNGGPTLPNGAALLTQALLPGSPALNAGSSTETNDQRGLARNDGNGVDIGAYEAQITPSADFDSDGDVDGADFLRWQRGFGIVNAQRADGNSDDDTDTDASDLAAWQVSFGQSQALPVAATVHADSDSPPSAFSRHELIDTVLALAVPEDGPEDLPVLIQPNRDYETNLSIAEVARADVPMASLEEDFLLPAEERQQSNSEQWLAEKLIERVFG